MKFQQFRVFFDALFLAHHVFISNCTQNKTIIRKETIDSVVCDDIFLFKILADLFTLLQNTFSNDCTELLVPMLIYGFQPVLKTIQVRRHKVSGPLPGWTRTKYK